MRHLLLILAALLLCSAPLQAQTLKSLMYNTANGQVVANTGTNVLTFTNSSVAFGNNATVITPTSILNNAGGVNFEELFLVYDGQEKLRWTELAIDISVPLDFIGTNTAPSTRTNLGLGATWLTNTNVTNFRTAIGLGETNDVTFNSVETENNLTVGGDGTFENAINVNGSGIFFNTNAAATTRTNLGIPLAALTNTSNVTMMRALAGVTNGPVTDSITLSDGGTSWTLTFSNGILVNITEL